jgi:hypothetical protein
LTEFAGEITANSAIGIDLSAGEEVIEWLFFNGINGNGVLTPGWGMGNTSEIRTDTTAAKFAWRDNTLVLACKTLEIAVWETAEERRITGKRHLKKLLGFWMVYGTVGDDDGGC